MKYMSTIPRYLRMLVYVGLLLLVEAGIVFVLVTPSIHDIRTLQKTVDERKQDLELRYQRGTRLNALKATYEGLNPAIEDWKGHFLREEKILDLITQLETLAGRSRVTKTLRISSAASSIKTPKGVEPYPLDLSIEGSFPNVIEYMRAIERLHIFYSMERVAFSTASLTLSPTRTEQQRGNVLVQVSGLLWKLK